MKRCHESTMFSRHIFPTASRRDHTPVISPFFFLPHSWNIVDCGFAGRFYDTHHRVRLQTNIFLVDKLHGICKVLALIFYTRTSSVSFDIFDRDDIARFFAKFLLLCDIEIVVRNETKEGSFPRDDWKSGGAGWKFLRQERVSFAKFYSALDEMQSVLHCWREDWPRKTKTM